MREGRRGPGFAALAARMLAILALTLATAALAAPGESDEALREREKAARAQDSPPPAPAPSAAAPQRQPDPPFRPLFAGVDSTSVSQVRIDVDTGSPFLAFSGYEVWGAAYDPTHDVLYFNSGATLYRWPVGGAVASLGTITFESTAKVMVGLAFYAGKLYGSSSSANEAIYEIDLSTRVATIAIDYADDEYDFGGIEIDPRTGLLYGTNDDPTPHGVGLYRINSNGTADLIVGYPDGQSDIDGLAIGRGRAYLVIDEPGSIYVYNFKTGLFELPISTPWGSSHLFAAGAWIDDLLFDDGFESYPPDWSGVAPPRCSGHCVSGGTPDNLCYCDALCLSIGDCCLDACATCGICP